MHTKFSFSRIISSLALICSLFLASCAAVQVGSTSVNSTDLIGARETINGLKSVIQQAPGTLLMENNDLVMAAWPKGTNYAFTLLKSSGQPVVDMNALKLDSISMATTMKGLEAQGWKQITPSDLPQAVLSALGAYSMELIMTGVQSMPTIFLIPAINLPTQSVESIQ